MFRSQVFWEERWAWILHQFWYFLDLWSWERYLTYWISFSSFVNWVYYLPYSFIKGWNYIRWVTHLGHSQSKELINTALWWERILPESLFPPITKIYPKYHISLSSVDIRCGNCRKINRVERNINKTLTVYNMKIYFLNSYFKRKSIP